MAAALPRPRAPAALPDHAPGASGLLFSPSLQPEEPDGPERDAPDSNWRAALHFIVHGAFLGQSARAVALGRAAQAGP